MKLGLLENSTPVNAMLNRMEKESRVTANKQLVIVIRALQLLSRQNVALRGNITENGKEVNSNIYQTVAALLEDHPTISISTMRYMSPDVQNELVDIMAQQIQQHIISGIKSAKYYTLLADESTDITNKTQLCFALRWISDEGPEESFIGMHHITDATANGIVMYLKSVLIRLGLDLKECRGQCYDGASVMRGSISGVSTQILAENPKAIYIHCLAHALNLSVEDTVKSCKFIRDSLAICQDVCALLKKSPKRESILESLKLADDATSGKVTSFCPTRWTVRAQTMKQIMANYSYLMELWEILLDGHCDSNVSKILGVQVAMKSYNFLFGVKLGIHLLSYSDKLATSLQDPKLSTSDARCMAVNVTNTLKALRSNEKFDAFIEEVDSLRQSLGVSEPVQKRHKKTPQRLDDHVTTGIHLSPAEEAKRSYMEALDCITNSITSRFNQPGFTTFLNIELLLSKLLEQKDYAAEAAHLAPIYEEIDFSSLNVEAETLSHATGCPTSLSGYQEFFTVKRNRSQFPNVCLLYKLMLLLPATNASSERAFSALKRVKTSLRNSMSQSRLVSLMLLHENKSLTDQIDRQQVIRDFVSCHSYRHRDIAVLAE